MADDEEQSPQDGGDQTGGAGGQGSADAPIDDRSDSDANGSRPDADSGQGTGKVPGSPADEQRSWGNVYQAFYGNVSAAHGIFGIGGAAAPECRQTLQTW